MFSSINRLPVCPLLRSSSSRCTFSPVHVVPSIRSCTSRAGSRGRSYGRSRGRATGGVGGAIMIGTHHMPLVLPVMRDMVGASNTVGGWEGTSFL